MTIPLCEKHKTEMKPGCPPLKTFNNFLVQYGLKKQAHYKVRGGECVQRDLAVPHNYVYRMLFQAQINVGIEPRNLIFVKTILVFSVSVQSLSVSSNIFIEETICQKSYIQSAVELMFTNLL